MINLHSKTGLGRFGHVWFQSFGPIWHVSGPEMVFWRNNLMILHHFCWRSSKIKLFWPKTLIFDQKFPKIPKNRLKYKFFLGFPRFAWHGSPRLRFIFVHINTGSSDTDLHNENFIGFKQRNLTHTGLHIGLHIGLH